MISDKEETHKLLEPYEPDEIFEIFHKESGSINKHLLTIYSMVIGVDAKRVMDIGAGSTTRTIRAALKHTNGEQYTCDWDKEKWQKAIEAQPQNKFYFYATDSKTFLNEMKGPFDFVLHDGAHDLLQVSWDLKHIWPMVRQFGLICIHDTQHTKVGGGMLEAIKKGMSGCLFSWTHLPYDYGLTIIRIEQSQPFPPLETPWRKMSTDDYTKLETCGLIDFNTEEAKLSERSSINFLKWFVDSFRQKRK